MSTQGYWLMSAFTWSQQVWARNHAIKVSIDESWRSIFNFCLLWKGDVSFFLKIGFYHSILLHAVIYNQSTVISGTPFSFITGADQIQENLFCLVCRWLEPNPVSIYQKRVWEMGIKDPSKCWWVMSYRSQQ